MGPTALYRYMQSEGLQVPTNRNALGAALWNAAKSGRIKTTPEDRYALLEWDTNQPEPPYAPHDVSAYGVESAMNDTNLRASPAATGEDEERATNLMDGSEGGPE
jgi:hypothetical protein